MLPHHPTATRKWSLFPPESNSQLTPLEALLATLRDQTVIKFQPRKRYKMLRTCVHPWKNHQKRTAQQNQRNLMAFRPSEILHTPTHPPGLTTERTRTKGVPHLEHSRSNFWYFQIQRKSSVWKVNRLYTHKNPFKKYHSHFENLSQENWKSLTPRFWNSCRILYIEIFP